MKGSGAGMGKSMTVGGMVRACFLACGLFAAGVADAQQSASIAAVVNDEAVTLRDLTARTDLTILFSNLADTDETRRLLAPRVMQDLIDERLQLQEAERLDIKVNEAELARELAAIEEQNGLPPGGLESALRGRGIAVGTLLGQLRANVAWRRVLRRQLLPRIEVGADEVEERLAELRRLSGSTEYYVSEIFLPAGDAAAEAEALATAEDVIGRLRGGTPFPALARQFSRSPSAAVGGDLGRLISGRFDGGLEAVLRDMRPGRVSHPIRTADGFHILLLRGRRDIGSGEVEDTRVALKRLFLPLPADSPSAEATAVGRRAASASVAAGSCADMERVAEEVGAQAPVDLGTVRLGDLPEDLRATVLDAPLEEGTAPIRRTDGFLVLMVCGREAPEAVFPSPEEVEEQLRGERIGRRAERYLLDLRQAAVIDMRL